jgi:hypothetical protein
VHSRTAVVLAVAWLTMPARVFAQEVVAGPPPAPQAPVTGPRDNAKPKDTGSARISGRVVNAETGTPLRRAVVVVMGEGLKRPYSASTDESGRYEIKDLPPGRYSVNASKAGYGSVGYGQKRPFQPGKSLELRDGETAGRIDFGLPKGGVITGRVTDEFGEPLANVTVRAMRYSYGAGKRQLTPVQFAGTDDRGQFRLFSLPASDYYVAAQANGGMDFAESDSRDGFALTYYPGTPSQTDAQRVRVAAGAEQGPISFALVPSRGAKVSGTVITSSGSAGPQGFLMLQSGSPDDGSFDMRGGSMIEADGTFAMSNVAPGDYVLHLQLGGGTEESETGSLAITVAGEDLTGLTLTTAKPTRLAGQLVFDGTPPEKLRPAEFMVWAHPANPTAMSWGDRFTVKDDWTIEGRASTGPLIIEGGRFPDGWMLKSVLLDGVDVTDSGVPIRGEPVDGLQLVVTSRITKLSGTASDDLNRPARDYQVVVFPDDASQWRRFSQRQRVESPDQQGRFEIARLPPGHYLAAAVDYVEEGQQADPELLESLRASATAFELREGETKTLALKVVRR